MAVLQVALDVTSLNQARALARCLVSRNVRVEVGTPLIMKYGMRAVRETRSILPGHHIVADCKTMDRGMSIARMCAEAGADAVIVQAAADEATIDQACQAAGKYKIEVMMDSLGVDVSVVQSLQRGYAIAHTIRHVGKDLQLRSGVTALDGVAGRRHTFGSDPFGADSIAGGITVEALRREPSMVDYPIVIVGEAIYASSCPEAVIAEALELLATPSAA